MMNNRTYNCVSIRKILILLTAISFIVLLREDSIDSFGKISLSESLTDNSSPSEYDLMKNLVLEEFFSVVKVSSENVFQIYPLEPIFTYRSLCSVESWALNHPNSSIWYTFTVKELQDADGLIHTLMSQYPNLKFIYVDLKNIFDGTPLSNFSKSSPWEKSGWAGVHLSDLLRQTLVWHKGGYYSDTDVYPVKSLNMFRNFILAGNVKWVVDPALFHFDAHHPYVEAFMEVIANSYQPKIRNIGGPRAGLETAKRLCNSTINGFLANGEIKNQAENVVERDCTVDGHNIHFMWSGHCVSCCGECLKADTGKNFTQIVQETYAFHTCNSLSGSLTETFKSKSRMQVMAERNCPVIFKLAQKHSKFW